LRIGVGQTHTSHYLNKQSLKTEFMSIFHEKPLWKHNGRFPI